MYYTQEADLARDAKKTELEFAKARVLVSKLKCAFIGGKLPIIRMILMVLALGVLFIPSGSVTVSLPFFCDKISISGLGLYNLFSNGVFGVIPDYLNCGLAEGTAVKTLVWLSCYLAAVLSVGLLFLFWLLSFFDIQKGAKRLKVISLIYTVLSGITGIAGIIVKGTADLNVAEPYTFLEVSLGAGAFIMLLSGIAFFVINALIIKSGVAPEIKEADRERIQIGKKVKAGEIHLDELPLPILETEEEREKRLRVLGGETKKEKKKNKKGGKSA